jgi:hypothetical protein
MFLLALLFSLMAHAEKDICYDKETMFAVSIPEGWVNDTEAAKKTSHCLVLYPLGHIYGKSPVTMNVKFMVLKNTTLEKAMEKAVKFATIGNKDARVEEQAEYTNPHGLTFLQKRIFKKRGNPFEAHGYVKSPPGLQVVLTTKLRADTELYEGTFKEFISDISLIEKERLFDFLTKNAEDDASMPTGKGFKSKYLHSLGEKIPKTFKTCLKSKGPASPAVFRVNESGQIMDWFDKKKSPLNECVSKKLVGSKGTKAPFGPFHVVLDLDSYLKNFASKPDTQRR